MRFLVDMALSPSLAQWLSDAGRDTVHAAELGMHRAPDFDILSRAKSEQRTVITADLDYPRLLALSRDVEPSVIVFRDGNWGEAEIIVRMEEVLNLLSEQEISTSIITVEKERVRRCALPLKRAANSVHFDDRTCGGHPR